MNKFILFFSFMVLQLFSGLSANAFINDDFIEIALMKKELPQPEINLNYNYESFDKVPVNLKILNNISTKKHALYEGQEVRFAVSRDVKYKNSDIIKKGTIVTARIETYITRGMNGIPASLIIGNFDIPGLDKNKIKGPFIKRGRSLTLFVLPLKWALTPIPGVGSLTNFITGGNVSITTKDDVVIYYYPNWNEISQNFR